MGHSQLKSNSLTLLSVSCDIAAFERELKTSMLP